MKEKIEDIHQEIRHKMHKFKHFTQTKPEFLVLNMSLWYDIQSNSKEIIPPEHVMKPDGFWYIFGLKVAVLDGSNMQERHLKVT